MRPNRRWIRDEEAEEAAGVLRVLTECDRHEAQWHRRWQRIRGAGRLAVVMVVIVLGLSV